MAKRYEGGLKHCALEAEVQRLSATIIRANRKKSDILGAHDCKGRGTYLYTNGEPV